MSEWLGRLEGRVTSKKNSKQIWRNKATGRMVIAPSKAYKARSSDFGFQLAQQRPKFPIAAPFELYVVFDLKGRIDADLDNIVTSVLDTLADAGVIANDKLCVHLDARKRPGHHDFVTHLRVLY